MLLNIKDSYYVQIKILRGLTSGVQLKCIVLENIFLNFMCFFLLFNILMNNFHANNFCIFFTGKCFGFILLLPRKQGELFVYLTLLSYVWKSLQLRLALLILLFLLNIHSCLAVFFQTMFWYYYKVLYGSFSINCMFKETRR